MIYTELQLANLALNHLGITKPIVSLTENSEESNAFDRAYPNCRRFLLSKHDWGFSRKTCKLEKIVTLYDIFNFKYAYKYPERDPHYLVRVIKVFDPLDPIQRPQLFEKQMVYTTSTSNYAIALLTNVDNAYCVGVTSVTDVSSYDDPFLQALSFLLAAYMSPSLTKDLNTTREMLKIAMSFISTGEYINKSENIMTNIQTCDMIEARI